MQLNRNIDPFMFHTGAPGLPVKLQLKAALSPSLTVILAGPKIKEIAPK